MATGKRKRYTKDIKCIFFPDDVRNGVKKVGTLGREPSLPSISATKSWERCGDSFLDTPVMKNLKSSGRKLSAVRKLSKTPASAGANIADEEPVQIAWSSSDSEKSDSKAQKEPVQIAWSPSDSEQSYSKAQKEPVQIAWSSSSDGEQSDNEAQKEPVQIAWSSSSDREQSDSEAQKQALPRVPGQPQQRPRTWRRRERLVCPIQSYTRALRLLCTNKEDDPVIDADSDWNESDNDFEENEKDNAGQISECESVAEALEENTQEPFPEPTPAPDLEISGFASDGENGSDTVTQSRLCSESSAGQTVEGSKRSVGDWVRSAQAMLQTPQKPFDRHSKTPEDSTKKRRKLQSGGLAERLNRLQCRQRSAISFWRHQSLSDTGTATVDRPGVLVLEVLAVQEECSMQLAQCSEQRGPPHSEGAPPHPHRAQRVLVLFNKETAAQLVPAPRDIIHIYPPWQSLTIKGVNGPVILNTHFSQKVYSDSNMASIPRVLLPAVKCIPPYSLTKAFGRLQVLTTTEEEEVRQVAATHGTTKRCCGVSEGTGKLSDSLLEAIEGLGQSGSSAGQDVEVVVQRVYSVPVAERSVGFPLKSKVPPGECSSALLPPPQNKTRLCALVQDGYGMFSVVQLHLLSCDDHLHRYSGQWQGRACVLRAFKVVKRVTRDRCTRLFDLIDSLWPPAMPLKVHGDTTSNSPSSASRPPGSAPSFCYLLSAQEGSVEHIAGQHVSPLYLPPMQRTLRDLLQVEPKGHRCSFAVTVVYKRMQSSEAGRGETWLVLTDPSLQDEREETAGPACRRRTLAVHVSASCVLTSSVVKALNSTTACELSVSDAVKECGAILCSEQTVVQLLHPLEPEGHLECTARPEPPASRSLTMPRSQKLPQPVRLDPLCPETAPNSLCTLTGVIVGVDEGTAYSWPVCNLCRSDCLEMSAESPQEFHCASCNSALKEPAVNMRLEVFLRTSLSNCTVKVKLQQNTIMSVLDSTGQQHNNEFPGYEMENVLGKEVGPLSAYVRVVTRKPALWIGLEEIRL